LAFAPGGRLVTVSEDGTGRIWSVETGKSLAVLGGGGGALRAAAWSPDGKTIVTGGRPDGVRVWDPDGKPRKTIPLGEPRAMILGLYYKAEAGSTGSPDVVVTWRRYAGTEGHYDHGTTFVNLEDGTARRGMKTCRSTAATPMSTALSATL